MNCSPNIITANFSGGKTSATTAALWQWDYGQVLCITGIEDLPAAFEVHFSTNKSGGVSTVAVGADGQVTIPNVLLTIGKNINAWIYLSEAQGEGETEYSILIPVKERPMPETYDAEVTGEFDDVVRQVSEYAETAQTAANSAGASATAAAGSASAAAASADSAAQSASAAAASETAAANSAGRAETSKNLAEFAADHAAQSLRAAAEKADEAAASATSAEQSKTAAAQSASAANSHADRSMMWAGTAEELAVGTRMGEPSEDYEYSNAKYFKDRAQAFAMNAESSATTASAKAAEAAQSATAAQSAAQTATTKAAEASASATAAEAAKTAAQTAQAAAEAAKDTAVESSTTATAKAAEAAQSASDADADADRAEDAAELAQAAVNAVVITETASGNMVTITDGADGMPLRSLSVGITAVQSGSGDPSPENIRPISGFDAVTVARSCVNLLDASHLAEASGWSRSTVEGYTELDGVPVYTGTARGLFTAFSEGYPMTANAFEENTQYTATLRWRSDASTANGIKVGFMYTDGTKEPYGTSAGSPTWKRQTLTSAEGKTVEGLYFTYNSNYTIMMAGLAVVKASEYDENIVYPSVMQTVTIPLDNTVYGGTLDVMAGKLTVNAVIKTFTGKENWTVNTNYPNTYIVGRGNIANTPPMVLCNYYPSRELTTDYTIKIGASINFRDSRFATVDDFKAYLAECYNNGNPVTVVATAATPTETSLASANLTTIKGLNKIWSDAGDVSVDYVADTKLYIEALTEPDADMVADANITSGHYFMVGNSLYLATANIASGAAITPGVNCNKTNLAEALNAINS